MESPSRSGFWGFSYAIPSRVRRHIRGEYFTNPVCAEVANTLRKVYDQSRDARVSRTTLSALLRPKVGEENWPTYREYLGRIFKLKITDKEVLADQAREFYIQRRYQSALIRAEEDVTHRRYELVQRRFAELRALEEEGQDLGLDYWEGIRSANRYKSGRTGMIPTGLKELDKHLQGGLAEGELGIVLAGGKVGKTMLLANLAVAGLKDGKAVAIATGELGQASYLHRIDGIITGLRVNKLRLLRKEAQEKLLYAQRILKGSLHIKQFPTGKGSTADIEDWLDRLEAEKGREIDLLVVDYVFVFRPAIASTERRINIGQVGVELRGIATARQIPVWTASQTNREGA